MAEPDGVMAGPPWPPDWQTGWISGRWTDITGAPLTSSVTVTMSVEKAASAATHTTIVGGKITVEIVDGVPSGVRAVLNGDGVPCFEFPITSDPDIEPANLQLVITSPSGPQRRYLTQSNTLENPLWLTGDLTSIEKQPGVIRAFVFTITEPPYEQPADAVIGDMVVFKKSNGELVEVYVVS
jgi:hypothetical protein